MREPRRCNWSPAMAKQRKMDEMRERIKKLEKKRDGLKVQVAQLEKELKEALKENDKMFYRYEQSPTPGSVKINKLESEQP